jgi:hypothetical protein
MTKGYNDMNMLETFLSKVVEINVLNLKPGQILVRYSSLVKRH